MINRKGQEEIVGFVLIMVIVAIVLLVLLGIMLRQDAPDARENVDVLHFLESSMEYTTDCATRFVPDYSTLGELVRNCHEGASCLDGRDSCDVLSETLEEIMDSSWQTGSDRPVKGYNFTSQYILNDEVSGPPIITLSEGNCTGRISGSTHLMPSFPGRITSELVICY